jgi:hypothetical protein
MNVFNLIELLVDYTVSQKKCKGGASDRPRQSPLVWRAADRAREENEGPKGCPSHNYGQSQKEDKSVVSKNADDAKRANPQ